MATSDVLRVSITKQSRASNRVGFGRALMLAINTPLTDWDGDRIKQFNAETALSSLKTHFGTDSEEYAWGTAALSQSVKPDIFYIGTREAAVAQQKTITIDADFETGDTFVATVNGEDVSVPFTVDHAGTCAAIDAAITACPGIASVTTSGAPIRVFTIVAEDDWLITIDGLDVTGAGAPNPVLATTVAGRTINSDIDDLTTLSRDWYMLASLDRTAGHILEAARGIQAADRMFMPVSLDAAVIDDTETLDIASRLQALEYDRTALVWHDASAEYIDAAVIGRFLPLGVGKKVFANKPLVGITLPDLTADEAQALKDKGANFYNDISGRGWFWPGKTADGGFMDTRLNLDYLLVNVREDALDNIEKVDIVPYTQQGVDTARGWVMNRLEVERTQSKIIASYAVPEINVTAIVPDKKDNRILPDINFSGKMTGAIQEFDFVGTMEV